MPLRQKLASFPPYLILTSIYFTVLIFSLSKTNHFPLIKASQPVTPIKFRAVYYFSLVHRSRETMFGQ